MLQAIRSKAGSFVVKLLFVLLILTFGIWGIGDIFRTASSDTSVATVGDHSVRADELQTALRRAIEQLSARFGSAIDLQQAKQLGLIDQTLGQLIDRSLVDQEVARLRLDVSDELIRDVITSNPNFRGTDGRFDRGLFNAVLAANRLTEEQYVALLRHDIPRNDLLHAVSAGAVAPQSMVDLLYRYQNEKRIADIVSLPIAAVGDVGQPSETELNSFYEAHQDLFRAPEYRGFTVASLTSSDIAKDIEIPEAKLKEEYEQRQDELQLPERREVEQILAPSEEKAKEAEAALAAGKDWREVATTIAGQDPDTIDLGLLKREELPSALADAVFELPLNQPSEPVKTPLGWHIHRQDRAADAHLRWGCEARRSHASGSRRSHLQGRKQGRRRPGGEPRSRMRSKIRAEDDRDRCSGCQRSRSLKISRGLPPPTMPRSSPLAGADSRAR
jgi:peptidyl-prolyl cis-trans isomerase D